MNKQIEKYISHAMPLLAKEKELNKEYKGYIASLGPAVNMSGLVPALAFYSSKENSAKADRSKVLQWIYKMLIAENAFEKLGQYDGLLSFALSLADNEKQKLERLIMDSIIALKLSLRTFELKD